MTTWRAQGSSVDDDLPAYLAQPGEMEGGWTPGLRDAWDAARKVAASLAASPLEDPLRHDPLRRGTLRTSALCPTQLPGPPRAVDFSSAFLRLVALPGAHLGAMLGAWWVDGEHGGAVVVDGRLRLEAPRGDARGGWTIDASFRRRTTVRWIPVVVELWPVHDRWAMMTMTPRRRVIATRRYFRVGHAVLDRFTAQLASRWPTGARPQASR